MAGGKKRKAEAGRSGRRKREEAEGGGGAAGGDGLVTLRRVPRHGELALAAFSFQAGDAAEGLGFSDEFAISVASASPVNSSPPLSDAPSCSLLLERRRSAWQWRGRGPRRGGGGWAGGRRSKRGGVCGAGVGAARCEGGGEDAVSGWEGEGAAWHGAGEGASWRTGGRRRNACAADGREEEEGMRRGRAILPKLIQAEGASRSCGWLRLNSRSCSKPSQPQP